MAIHKPDHAVGLDPNCEECQEKTIGGLGRDWMTQVLGITPGQLDELTDPSVPAGEAYDFEAARRLLLIFRYEIRGANALKAKYERQRLERQGAIS